MELTNVDLQNGIRVVVPPVPVILALTLTGSIPTNVRMMMLLPVDPPSSIFVFVEIVMIFVALIVHVVTIITTIVVIASVLPILCKQIS